MNERSILWRETSVPTIDIGGRGRQGAADGAEITHPFRGRARTRRALAVKGVAGGAGHLDRNRFP